MNKWLLEVGGKPKLERLDRFVVVYKVGEMSLNAAENLD